MNKIDKDRLRKAARFVGGVVAAAIVLLAVSIIFVSLTGAHTGAVGVVSAANNTSTTNQSIQDKAPYYRNQSTTVDSESWMAGRNNATLDNVIHYATRIGTFVIGNQQMAGGVGYAGPLVLGLVILGVFMGALAGTRPGSVGGGVLAIIIAGGLVDAGLAPQWMFAIVLFALGAVGTSVYLRSVR